MKGDFEFLYAAFEDEKSLLTLLDAAPQAIFLIDKTFKIVLVNDRVESILGYSGDELLNQPLDVLLPDELREKHGRMVEGFMKHPRTRQMGQGIDLIARRKDNTVIPVEIGLSYLHSSRGVLMMALLTDISERKRLEEEAWKVQKLQLELEKEQELRKVKNAFISMITHDFRNPLNAIRLTVDALEIYGKQINVPKPKHFDRLRENLQRIDDMIEQILALGQLEAAQVAFNPQPLYIHEFCQEIVERFEQRSMIEMNYKGQNVPLMLDPTLLDHILSNLLSNAIKYSPPFQTIHMDISEPPNQLVFEIHDRGIGIPADERLFEAFQRGQNVGNIPGTGLGLLIVKTYTELHGGKVAYKSRENVGSTFQVTLPRVPA